MPSIETMERNQHAVYWPRSGTDRYGQPKVGDAVPLKVKWDYVNRDILDAQGNTIKVEASVVVDRDIAIGSIMWYGKLCDMSGTSHLPESDLMEVQTFNSTADLKGRNYRRTVQLSRLRDSPLPT